MNDALRVLLIGSAIALGGCGSDSDPAPAVDVPTPKPDETVDHHGHEIFGPKVNHTMSGKTVYFYWNEREGNDSAMVRTPPKSKPIVIQGDNIIRWLNENHGGESLRNQHIKTYKPGNFSMFDVFVYAAEHHRQDICLRWQKAPDCKVEVDYRWEPERQTFEFTINGESNWKFAQDYHNGVEKDEGFWGLEMTESQRPDQVISKDGQKLGIAPYDQEKVDFFKQLQREEVAKLNANDGKVIIPAVTIFGLPPKVDNPDSEGMVKLYVTGYVDDQGNPGTMPGPQGSKPLDPVFSENLEDALMDDNGNPEFYWGYVTEDGYTNCGLTGRHCVYPELDQVITNLEVYPHNIRPDYYYDGVITLADVFLSLNDYVDENGNKPYSASLIWWPTLDTGAIVETYALNSVNGVGSSGFYGWGTGWDFDLMAQHPEMEIAVGYGQHMVGDTAILTHPDSIYLGYNSMYDMYYGVQRNIAGDIRDPYRLTRKNVLAPFSPLPVSHFGWGVADCAMCHTATHVNVANSDPSHLNSVEPARCAECHGSNGAPKGHNQVAGCYRCHQDMVGHGDAIETNKTVHPFAKTGSGLSTTLPDPYACVSCHYNDNPVVLGE